MIHRSGVIYQLVASFSGEVPVVIKAPKWFIRIPMVKGLMDGFNIVYHCIRQLEGNFWKGPFTIVKYVFDLKIVLFFLEGPSIQFLNGGKFGIQSVSHMLRFELWHGWQRIPLEHLAYPFRIPFKMKEWFFDLFDPYLLIRMLAQGVKGLERIRHVNLLSKAMFFELAFFRPRPPSYLGLVIVSS